jgi:hypothetical protein
MNRFIKGLETAAKDTGKVAAVVVPAALPLVPVFGEPAAKVVTAVLTLQHGEQSPMNPLEQFAITMVLGIIQSTVKNPTHKAAVQTQLVGLATDIFEEYGMTVPEVPAAVATAH